MTQTAALAPPPPPRELDRGAELGLRLARAALGAAWAARHPREPFAHAPDSARVERFWYATEDGWECPLWRLPAARGASGEPVVLLHAVGANRHSFDFSEERSLARALHQRGFDVFLVGVRGERDARPPAEGVGYDFDDIVSQDVPAALARVRELSDCPRVLWVGHGLGGQLLVAHVARGGAHEVAGAVSLCAAVRFEAPRSHARLIQAASLLLPDDLRVPLRALHAALAPTRGTEAWARLGQEVDGPVARGLMLHGVEDVRSGLLRQVARWLSTGTLCDRDDSVDYLVGATGCEVPLLVIGAGGDEVCPPHCAAAVVDHWQASQVRWHPLDATWGHLDPLVGPHAPDVVYPEIIDWLDRARSGCWSVAPLR